MNSLTDEQLRQQLKASDPLPDAPDEQLLDQAWKRILSGDARRREPKRRRRWAELALAGCLGAALVGGGVLVSQQFTAGGSHSSSVAGQAPVADASAAGVAVSSEAGKTESSPTLARDASAVVSTSDVRAARDSFVATVNQLNGTVLSESTTTGPDQPVSPASDISIYPPV